MAGTAAAAPVPPRYARLSFSPRLALQEKAAAQGVTLVTFDEALALADFHSLHMPLTAGTKVRLVRSDAPARASLSVRRAVGRGVRAAGEAFTAQYGWASGAGISEESPRTCVCVPKCALVAWRLFKSHPL